jgi:hypothetical protein
MLTYNVHSLSLVVSLSLSRNVQIKLEASLVQSLQFTKIADYKVAYLDGIIQDSTSMVVASENGSSDAAELEQGSTSMPSSSSTTTDGAVSSNPAPASTDVAQIPYLVAGDPAQIPGHDTVFVGDLVLSEFSRVLTEAGYRVCIHTSTLPPTPV